MQAFKNFQSRVGSRLFNTQRFSQKSHKLIGFQLFLSGMFAFQNYKNYTNLQKNAQCADKVKYTPFQSNIQFEDFSDQAYKDALENKYDVIIVVEPDRFREEFIDEIKDFLEKFKNFQGMVKGRPIKIFRTVFKSRQDMNDFSDKYNVRIERDTIFLLKNKYLEAFYAFGSYEWFENKEYFFKYYKTVSKLNNDNYEAFSKNLNELTHENIVILGYADKSDTENYKKFSKTFGKVSLLKEYSENPSVHLMLVNSKEVAEKLGLEKSGDIYLMQKSSKFNYKASNKEISGIKFQLTKSGNLNNDLFTIVEKNVEAFQQNNIFSLRSFDKENTAYTIVLELNQNKLTKQEQQKLIKTMGEFKKSLLSEENQKKFKPDTFQFVILNRHKEKRKFTIYARDDINIMKSATAHSVTNADEIKKLNIDESKSHSYIYNFPVDAPLEKEELTKWYENVTKGEVPEFFKSKEAPFYRKYSKKLVGTTFKEQVLDNDLDQIVFTYSRHCHACRQYGPIYEEIGLQSLIDKNKGIEFNRINSDSNAVDCSENFPYTPVFQVFKKGIKNTPYVYRSDKFTPQLLKDFIFITTEFNVIPDDVFGKIYQNYQKIEVQNE